jgi:hypothetical protein
MSFLRLEGGIDQIIRTTHESEYASKRYWKHITSPQSAPNLFRFADTRDMRRICEVGRVHRAHGGAEDQICADAGMHQLMQHADLDGSHTAAARKDKGRPLGGMGHARSSLNLSSVRSELNRNSSLGRGQCRGHAATAFLVSTCRTSRGSARSR